MEQHYQESITRIGELELNYILCVRELSKRKRHVKEHMGLRITIIIAQEWDLLVELRIRKEDFFQSLCNSFFADQRPTIIHQNSPQRKSIIIISSVFKTFAAS